MKHNYLFPEGRIKNTLRNIKFFLRDLTLNLKHKLNFLSFKEQKQNKIYTYTFKSGIKIKSIKKLFLDYSEILPGYLKYWRPEENSIIIDAGAFYGMFSIYCSKRMKNTGKIYAFEPEPENLEILRQNIKINNCKNIEIIEKALWNKITKLKFSDKVITDNSEAKKTTIVQTTTIDNFVEKENLKQLNMIKMDIEGNEIQAIQGAEQTIKKFHPYLAIASYHEVNKIKTWKYLENFLKKFYKKTKTTHPKHLTTYGLAEE